MKIFQIITNGDEFYGAQKHVLDLSVKLNQFDHEVYVLTGSRGALTEKLEKLGIDVLIIKELKREIHILNDIIALLKIKALVRKYNPDIVATHSSKAGVIGRLAAFLNNVPRVFTAHGWSFEDNIPQPKRSIYMVIERLMSKISTKIITVSEKGKELAIANNVTSSNEIAVIHYGVQPLVNERTIVNSNDVFVMTMVAGFREQKDHKTILYALSKLRNLNWKIYFLGNGNTIDRMKRLSVELGIDDKVNFEGAVENVAQYLSYTDLMVLSTNYEGLPISIIEALSMGLPVVATDVSGISEQVIHGYNGYLVPWKDINKLADTLKECIENSENLKILGKNSLKLFEEKFTIEEMFMSTVNLYEKCIKNLSI